MKGIDPCVLQCKGLGFKTFPASVCAFCLYGSVSAGCASTAQLFTNPHSAPDCLFLRFSVEVLCSPPLFGPALAFWLHSSCPTADEDIAVGCLSSLWRWSALMDIPGLADTQMVDGLMLYIQSLHGTCWSYSCCRQAVPSGNLPSPFPFKSSPVRVKVSRRYCFS